MSDSRPYQLETLAQVRKHYAEGTKRVFVHLPTGAGKTHVFCKILAGVFNRGKYAIMVVRGKDLVSQASDRLTREGIPHGCLQANHWNYRPDARIQVCSVDTLYRRKLAPRADLVVIDEAHLTGGSSYAWLLEHYKDSYLLPVSATPYGRRGVRHVADIVVAPVGVGDLIAQGYLVPPRYFAPIEPDLTHVHVDSTGDYNNAELFQAMEKSTITGSIVDNYRKHSPGHSAVCFAVNVAHSLSLAKAFNEAGIPAEHIEADTPDAERRATLGRLRTGETAVICNVGILCTGVDMPYLRTIIMARPTRSYNLFIQQGGRGTRPYEGKSHFILIDHAGNIKRHGLLTADLPAILDPVSKRISNKDNPFIRRCPDCFAVFHVKLSRCPECNMEFESPEKSMPSEVDGELHEINLNDPLTKARYRLAALKIIKKAKGYKRGWLYHVLKSEFNEEIANTLIPKREIPEWVKNR